MLEDYSFLTIHFQDKLFPDFFFTSIHIIKNIFKKPCFKAQYLLKNLNNVILGTYDKSHTGWYER